MNRAIFHLSFPVSDLDAALAFYTGTLGGVAGRSEPTWADVALFDAQVTLQAQPQDVLRPIPRSRHFGATFAWDDWATLTAQLNDFVEPPRIDHAGTDKEQAKAMIADPDGNLIELKAYRHPAAILGCLAS